MSDGHNGWTNYETWVCNLHISNDEGMSEMVREWAQECVQEALDGGSEDAQDSRREASWKMTARLRDFLEEWKDETIPDAIPGLFSDLLSAAINAVNLFEIAEHYVAEVDLWSAGWNMPGYMPDEVPALFLDSREAREYIAEYLEKRTEDPEFIDPARFEEAVQEIRSGRGELDVTIGDYHYFVTKV